MPADQRHRDRPVLGDRDDRRLFPLGGEEGRDRADQDTAGADTDNRPARLEQPADMSRHPIIAHIPLVGMGARPVQPGAGQLRPKSPAERSAPRAEHDDGNVLG